MSEIPSETDNLFEKITKYLQTSLELYQLKTIQKSAVVFSGLVSGLLSFSLLSMAFLIANIGSAFWLGKILGALYLGFVCSSGIYLVLALFLYLIRESLIMRPFQKYLLNLFVPNEDDEK